MSRQEKRSRIRMLPPRVQLQQRDALTGSYPTNVRFSTDGRTGNYKVNFDDQKVIDYNSITRTSDLFEYVIHYQTWGLNELVYENGTSYFFKQTMVGTPYSSAEKIAVENLNGTGILSNNNWFETLKTIATYPGNSQVHPNISSIYMNSAAGTDVGGVIDNDLLYTEVAPNRKFSISCWVRVTDTTSTFQPLFTLADPNGWNSANSAAWIVYLVNKKLRFALVEQGTEFNPPSSNYIMIESNANVFADLNKWYHICVTYDGSSVWTGLKIYVNGSLLTVSNKSNLTYTQMPSGNYSLVFGYFKGTIGTHYFKGYMSEFLYLGKELGLSEINTIYQYTLNGEPSLLQRYYGYSPAIGLSNDSSWLSQPDTGDIQDIRYTTIITPTGSVVASVVDNLPFIHFTDGQELTPFRDNDQPAVDGKSENNPFFATGSAVTDIGPGFTSPLWSKNKIEIDISVAAPCSATLFLSGANWSSATRPSFNNNTVDGISYEMCYYNFSSKTWQGAGTGTPYGFFHDTVNHGPSGAGRSPFEDRIMFGFAPGIVNTYPYGLNVSDANALKTQVTGVFEWQASAGQPFTNFGFPYHPKYHATGSQTLRMQQYINEPFLLEKIVIELSASYTVFAQTYNTASFLYDPVIADPAVTITSITQSTYPAAVNNIFILNQRKPIKFDNIERLEYFSYNPNDPLDDALLVTNVPTSLSLSSGGALQYVDTVRDIITWGGITSFAANAVTSSIRSGTPIYSNGPIPQLSLNPRELMTRDYVFTSSIEAHDDLTPLSWSGKISLELFAKSPIRIDRDVSGTTVYDNMFSAFNAGRGTNLGQITGNFNALKYSGGGRNALGINVPNARNYISPIAEIQENGSFIYDLTGVSYETILNKDEDRYKRNPYILLPTDELIIGWQQPALNSLVVYGSTTSPTTRGAKNALSGSFSEIKFLPGDAKITLYGSYIRAGREYNDGTNQLLSSDNIHEVIE